MTAAKEATIKVMLVADHALVRAGLRHMFAGRDGIGVIAECNHQEQPCETYRRCRPDVVILELGLPGMRALESLHLLLSYDAQARVLVFSLQQNDALTLQALSQGARGYVAEACFDDEILKAVMEVARGRIFLNGEMAQKMIAHTLGGERSPMQGLSGRELEVFGLLAEGRSVEEIAAMLHLSQKTVFNYQTALRQKLGISSPIDLLRMAQQLGLIAK